MKKKIVFSILILLSSKSIKAQDLSYGPLFGFNAYDLEIKGIMKGESGISALNLGGFLNYEVKNKINFKTNFLYNKTFEILYQNKSGGYFETQYTSLQISPNLKYKFNHERNKGVYLIGGPKFTLILNAKNEEGSNIGDFYKRTNLTVLLGFGIDFLNNFSLEIMADKGLTNMLKSDNNNTRNIGIYLCFLINLKSLTKYKNP